MRRPPETFAAAGAPLAHELLVALEQERSVERFVDSYVAEFDRFGLKADPGRYHELLVTLGREALLAMLTQVNAGLPHYLTRRRPSLLRGAEVQAADSFREGLLAALGRDLHWTPEEVEAFRRDLDLYARLGARTPLPRKRKPTAPPEGPFVDRCALLLDPSMLDKGRQAAGKFLAEIERVTEKTLARVLRARR